MFGFGEHMTIMYYIPKKGKNVLIISSFHNSDAIDPASGDKNKPEMITNGTKGGIDSVDQLYSLYDAAQNTRRWPMGTFLPRLQKDSTILGRRNGEFFASERTYRCSLLSLSSCRF